MFQSDEEFDPRFELEWIAIPVDDANIDRFGIGEEDMLVIVEPGGDIHA